MKGRIQSTSWGVWEEYRYDPLGRRVAVRTLRPTALCNQPAECYNSTTYFVWAGDQLLWEKREADATNNEHADGVVSYFQAGGIDRPLTIWKSGVGTVVTHQSWRGQFARGTFGNGPRAGQSSDCTEYPATNGCIPVQWPGWNTTAWSQEAAKPATTGAQEFWFGSLSVGMRDASGQQYMRNRYYNPQTGQFTQPDPIGLAGGLNSYGFAAGDPVSYADPYGLRPCQDIRNDISRRTRSLNRRIRHYLESAADGTSDATHRDNIEQERTGLDRVHREYGSEGCDDDDDHEGFGPTLQGAERALKLPLPAPQIDNRLGTMINPIPLNPITVRAPKPEEAAAASLLLMIIMMVVLAPVGA